MKTISVGIIGGGLMGKEVASAFGRWFVLNDFPVKPEIQAVCDIDEDTLSWYRQIPSIRLLTTDYKELLSLETIDVVYVAVPHYFHQEFYLEVLRAGKDLLGEKPFGIDLQAATSIRNEAARLGRFVRCSSEMPFLPGAQGVINEILSDRIGQIIQIKTGFLHSSDLDPLKPINWKRQAEFCGEIGVMGDLGMHVLHIPLRLGWHPETVYAHLQKIITKRLDGNGKWADCDTWNNATLNMRVPIRSSIIPMSIEMKRLAPGETNTWYIEVLGTQGGAKYSTKDWKTLWIFDGSEGQAWKCKDLGFQMPFSTVTGKIFEPGFPDCFMQMLAAFFAEREGLLNGKFSCATPEEAVESHRIFSAALESFQNRSVTRVSESKIYK